MFHLLRNATRKLVRIAARSLGLDELTGVKMRSVPTLDLQKIGSTYGGWVTPTALLSEGAICYCAGVGEDITFDLGLISRFNCNVWAFDPTPRARLHIESQAQNIPQLRFSGVGLWDKDEVQRFYAPANPEHVSHSILNLQQTERFFEAECRRLSSLMNENGHTRLDLLKLDIGGAEYRVIDSIIEDGLEIGIICVEHDEIWNPIDRVWRQRIRKSVKSLLDYGYALVSIDDTSSNRTFVRNELIRKLTA